MLQALAFLPQQLLIKLIHELFFEHSLLDDLGILFTVVLSLLSVQLFDKLIIFPLEGGSYGFTLSILFHFKHFFKSWPICSLLSLMRLSDATCEV